MTPDFIFLYTASAGVIALLAVFARENKKEGWVKTRTTVVEDLLTLRQIWEASDSQQVHAHQAVTSAPPMVGSPATPAAIAATGYHRPVVIPQSASPVASMAFSSQLSNLRSALKDSAKEAAEATAKDTAAAPVEVPAGHVH